ncbi:cytochrome b [Catenovulum agarivorans]|uniref:cytochrome b n=1 Tax=Catenovulum agarivorans TaxID=1172192 RepID=UPI0002DB15F4|nr:cytochrome b [Catenovulum agarivorans]
MTNKYSLISRLCHWLSAVLVLALFFVGIWMVELSYYDDWYQVAPTQHKNFGIILAALTIIRIVARFTSDKPAPIGEKWEQLTASITHKLMYLLLLTILISGYLISTASGKPILWFDWLPIPATIAYADTQADLAGDIHQYAAYVLIALVVLHVAGAIKHQLIDKKPLFKRMI